MDYIKLYNGVNMPILGFGTYFPVDNGIEDSIYNALCNGYRMLDTAKWYNNEDMVGRAILRSGVDRKDIFITSKIMCSNYEETINNVYDSLNKMNTDYFDLILIHWPDNGYLDTYKALEFLYEKGIAKAIGVSNFNARLCDKLISLCKVKPMVNQIETNIYFQEKKMNKYLNDTGIVHEGWAPFCEGYCDVLNDETLKEIAKRYNKTVAQVTLRFFIQKNIIVLPRSSDLNHIIDNLNVFDFTLNDNDVKTIENLDRKRQYSGWPMLMSEETRY